MANVQVLAYREYEDSRTGKTKTKEAFWELKIRGESVSALFKNIDKVVACIPEGERYNFHYTVANCADGTRDMIYQEIIPFDIDGMDVDRYQEYIEPVINALEVDPSKTGIVFSGHGLHFLIKMESPIENEAEFTFQRVHYKALCDKIDNELRKLGLIGNADPAVFCHARTLRLPNTINRKPNRPDVMAYIIQPNIEAQEFNMYEEAGVPVVQQGEHLHPRMMARIEPVTDAVLEGCGFIKHCKTNAQTISEPQWYAMLSVVARLDKGRDLCHEYSQGHDSYDPFETDAKIEQALMSSGPRTCSNIASLWGGCTSCPYFEQVTSPILITRDSDIRTANSGFHTVITDNNGIVKKHIPEYDDLMKFFAKKHPFKTINPGGMVQVYNGKHWQECSRYDIHAFAEKHFDPKPKNNMCQEFESKLKRNNVEDIEFFSMNGMINFNNGVYDFEKNELIEHSPEYGFTYVLPFDYDPQAQCPVFERYLDDVTCGDNELKQVLLEYMGYTLSATSSSIGQKALVLTGDGSNGKSVFLDLLKHLAGSNNYSTLSMGYEINKLENRYHLYGKLFNISGETPTKSLLDSSMFKAMVTGDEVQARRLYCDSFSMKCDAKIIMACNTIPEITDSTYGMFRRLLLIPFNATFTEENRDVHMREKLFAEASGIYNLVVKALLQFRRQEAFTLAAASEHILEQTRLDSSTLKDWVRLMMTCHPKYEDELTHVYDTLCDYYRGYGMMPPSVGELRAAVRRLAGVKLVRKMKEGKMTDMVEGARLSGAEQRGF